MADQQPRTQKQISLQYKDNLDYSRRGHPFRRLKLALFLLAVFGSIGAVFGFRLWGNKEYFNTGPISQNHAPFAERCDMCHDNAVPDLSRALRLDEAITGLREGDLTSLDVDKLRASAMEGVKGFSAEQMKLAAQRNLSPEKLSELSKAVIRKSSLAGMDRACLKCHEPSKLHMPQGEALGLRGVHPELPLVHAERCSTCHREHVGHGLMKVPGNDSCLSCHADAAELKRTRSVIDVTGANPVKGPENRELQLPGRPRDKLIRFLMPQEPDAQPAVIRTYADGHPPFHYERKGARDPANLKFNHQRHEQADIPLLNGNKLTCTDCHNTDAGGEFNKRITYEQHCSPCHALQALPRLPSLKVPHGDPADVSGFVLTLNTHILSEIIKNNPSAAKADIERLYQEQYTDMAARGLSGQFGGNELMKRVFYTGDPPLPPDRPLTGQFLPACVKCHVDNVPNRQFPANETAPVPVLKKVSIADRWIQHGPFTHLPHNHMKCDDCHGAVHKSRNTSDILLPPQKLCAECHRPLDSVKLREVAETMLVPKAGTADMARQQRLLGSVKWECQECHRFHATGEAIELIEASAKPAAAK